MVKAWRAGPGGTYSCPHCSAVYEVTVTRVKFKRSESAMCDACGQLMAEWNGKVVPSFKLVPDPALIERSVGKADQPVVAAIAEVVIKAVGRRSSKGGRQPL